MNATFKGGMAGWILFGFLVSFVPGMSLAAPSRSMIRVNMDCPELGGDRAPYSFDLTWRSRSSRTKEPILNWSPSFWSASKDNSNAWLCAWKGIQTARAKIQAACSKSDRLFPRCSQPREIEKSLLVVRNYALKMKKQSKSTADGQKTVTPLASPSVTPEVRPVTVPVIKKPNVATNSNCEPKTPLTKEIKQVTDLDLIPICKEPKVGDPDQIVNLSWTQSPTGLERSYRLKRTGPRSSEIGLNIKFQPASLNGLPLSESAANTVEQDMRKKLENCLKTANRALRGPHGEKLEIILDAPSSSRCAPPVNVQILPSLTRATSLTWSQKSPCPTILHEIMHLLGLVDEYKEEQYGYVRNPSTGTFFLDPNSATQNPAQAAWDCRALGPEDSLMAEPQSAYRSVFGNATVLSCQCHDAECCSDAAQYTSQKREWKPGTPLGLSNSTCTHTTTSAEDFSAMPPTLTQSNADNCTLKIAKKLTGTSQRDSLLYPAQFYALAFPDCEINKTYYTCAQNSQSTSFTRNGQGCKHTNLPPACSNHSTDWLSLKEVLK